jgi:cob(I)alamin adenosyltransferase
MITGNGKGKTTAALGMAMRAAGHKLDVLILRFCKGSNPGYYGEVNFIQKIIKPDRHINVIQYGLPRIVYRGNMTDEDIKEAQEGWKFAKYQILNPKYNMIILDELTICIDLEMINLREVKETLLLCPKDIEIVITGRNTHQDLIEISDYVNVINPGKHPFDKGIQYRKGIEY